MRRGRKKFLIILVAITLVISAGIIYLNSAILPVKIKTLIVRTIEDATQKKVSLGSLSFNIFKGVVLKNLAISDDTKTILSVKECSAIQLSKELDIPLATVYRKLKLLESIRLIYHVKTIINLQGNEERYYRCAIREAILHIDNGKLSLDLKKEDHSDKIIRLWKRLAHPDKEDT